MNFCHVIYSGCEVISKMLMSICLLAISAKGRFA